MQPISVNFNLVRSNSFYFHRWLVTLRDPYILALYGPQLYLNWHYDGTLGSRLLLLLLLALTWFCSIGSDARFCFCSDLHLLLLPPLLLLLLVLLLKAWCVFCSCWLRCCSRSLMLLLLRPLDRLCSLQERSSTGCIWALVLVCYLDAPARLRPLICLSACASSEAHSHTKPVCLFVCLSSSSCELWASRLADFGPTLRCANSLAPFCSELFLASQAKPSEWTSGSRAEARD